MCKKVKVVIKVNVSDGYDCKGQKSMSVEYDVLFFHVLFSSHHFPSMAGALMCVTVSSYLGLLHALQLLHHWLSLIADSVS